MAITVKDIAGVIGFNIEDEEKLNVEDVTKFIDEKFVSRENATKDQKIIDSVFGKTVGSLRTKIKQIGGFESKEIEGAKVEDLLDRLAEKHNTEVTTLKEKSKEGNDKKLNDLIAELESTKKAKEDFAKALEEKESYIQTKESEFSNTFKSYKVNDKLSKLKGSLNFIEDYQKKEVLKTGFDALIGSKYKFDLNDKEELEVFTIDGSHIKHPKKAGEFLKPEELLLQEAESQGLIKKNNAQEKKTIFVSGTDDNNGGVKSKVHPAARRNAERTTV